MYLVPPAKVRDDTPELPLLRPDLAAYQAWQPELLQVSLPD
jgi:hypothetical protein